MIRTRNARRARFGVSGRRPGVGTAEADDPSGTPPDPTSIARDLHDGPAQELWVARLKLERLIECVDDPHARVLAVAALDGVAAAESGVRHALWSLRDEVAGHHGRGLRGTADPPRRMARRVGVAAPAVGTTIVIDVPAAVEAQR